MLYVYTYTSYDVIVADVVVVDSHNMQCFRGELLFQLETEREINTVIEQTELCIIRMAVVARFLLYIHVRADTKDPPMAGLACCACNERSKCFLSFSTYYANTMHTFQGHKVDLECVIQR